MVIYWGRGLGIFKSLPSSLYTGSHCVQPNHDNNSSGTSQNHNTTASNKKKTYIVVPYAKGLSKNFNHLITSGLIMRPLPI